ncbi:hypothetical protein F2P81_003574 [Scophthalmus maximus]|uniref:Nitrite reductase n=1 Tax=Scophthalmus maximus TaxID=52904 RepID=A0A6A4T9Y2_SCOMX|nr:hypothetical protein F2P81_003574 [Scophthalmus maximus]
MEKLSGKDKELIRGSWESLGKNKVPHGVIMFSRLFELDPGLLSLFNYSTNCGSTQDCLSSPEFLEHVTKVVGESLLYMLQCSLGQSYTAPLRQAWLNMYSIVVTAMSRGWAKNGEDKAD